MRPCNASLVVIQRRAWTVRGQVLGIWYDSQSWTLWIGDEKLATILNMLKELILAEECEQRVHWNTDNNPEHWIQAVDYTYLSVSNNVAGCSTIDHFAQVADCIQL